MPGNEKPVSKKIWIKPQVRVLSLSDTEIADLFRPETQLSGRRRSSG